MRWLRRRFENWLYEKMKRIRLRQLDSEVIQKTLRTTGETQESLLTEYRAVRQPIETALFFSITGRLMLQAQFYTIDVPTSEEQPDWWEMRIDKRGGIKCLSRRGIAQVKKLIRAERRANIKFYAELLVPILSLLVALAAILSNSNEELP
jgi:hypothetical protein